MNPTLLLRALLVLIEHEPKLAIEFAGNLDVPVDLVKIVANWNPEAAADMPTADLVVDGTKEAMGWLLLHSSDVPPTTPA